MKKIHSAFFVFLAFLMLLYPTPAHASPRVGTGVYFDNIVTILMENTGINSTYDYCPSTPGCYVVGNSNAPFMNSIYPTRTAPFVSAFAEGYSGTTHPSAPNYESLLSGLENGLGGNYSSDSQVNWLDLGSNLVDSFTGAGVIWTAYAEGATGSGTCSFSPPRSADHFPFLMFQHNNVVDRCANFKSATTGVDTELLTSLNSSSPSNFYWLTPTDNNNCHDVQLSTSNSCDTWLNNTITKILATKAFMPTKRTALFVTFDEGGQFYPNDYVWTAVLGPQARHGIVSVRAYSHYSWLSTIEANWNLPTLTSNDRNALIMSDMYKSNAFQNVQANWDPSFTLDNNKTATGFNDYYYNYWHPSIHGHSGSQNFASIPNNYLNATENDLNSGNWSDYDNAVAQQGNFPWENNESSYGNCLANQQFNLVARCPRDLYGLRYKVWGDQYLTLNATMTLMKTPQISVSNAEYLIIIEPYFYFPFGNVTASSDNGCGASARRYLEGSVRLLTKVGTIIESKGYVSGFDPSNAFGYAYTAGIANVSQAFTLTNFNLTTFYNNALAFCHLPSTTQALLVGLEVGVEGWGSIVNTEWTNISIKSWQSSVTPSDSVPNRVDNFADATFLAGPVYGKSASYVYWGLYSWLADGNGDSRIGLADASLMGAKYTFVY